MKSLEQWMEMVFKDFDYINKHIQITWRVKIKGSLESTSFFTKGDKVSVIYSNRYK
jgi:hypothetical protein